MTSDYGLFQYWLRSIKLIENCIIISSTRSMTNITYIYMYTSLQERVLDLLCLFPTWIFTSFHLYNISNYLQLFVLPYYISNKGNNKITELRTIFQKQSQNSWVYKQIKSINNRKTVKTVMTLTWYRHF